MKLEARGVTFGYGSRAPVLRKLSVAIEAGQRLALVGPSGCGKSTLGKILAGYERPSEGEILIDGRAAPRRGCNPVQLVHQSPEFAFNPRWSVGRSLREGGEPDPKDLEALDVERGWLGRFPHELSGGQLQRLAIVRSLAAHPRFLIADEITGMLDPISGARIWRVLLARAAQHRIGLLIITHDRALARALDAPCIELNAQQSDDRISQKQRSLTAMVSDSATHLGAQAPAPNSTIDGFLGAGYRHG